jgi:thymidylate synthase
MNNKIAIISSMNDKRTPYNGIKIGGEETIYEKYNKKYLEKKMNPYGDSKKDYSLIDWNDGNKKWEQVDAITRVINKATDSYADRRAHFVQANKIFI